MDYAAFLYLNPELCLSKNISTVEGAKFYLDALSGAELAAVDADLSAVPPDFEPAVYIADGGLELNVSLLDSAIRVQTLNEGMSQLQADHNQSYADNLVQDISLSSVSPAGAMHFGYSPFMTTANVMLNDRVRVLVDDADFFRAAVTAVDYDARTLSLTPEAGALPIPARAVRYRLYSVLVADARRIAVINYVRRATGRAAKTAFDSEFNLRLYQLLYPDSRLMQRDTAYVDYLGRQNTDDYRVGREQDLLLNKDQFIWPTMRLSDLEVTGSATFAGGVSFDGAMSVSDALSVAGPATFSNGVSVAGDVALSNALEVSGSTILKDALEVSGPTTLSNTLEVSGAVSLNDSMDVSGATTLSNTLEVSGAVSLNDSLEVSGATTLSNTLEVSGAVSLNDSLDVSGATTLSNTLEVSGAVSLNDSLDVSGATTLSNSLDVSGAVSLNDSLDVSGATTLSNSLDVSGAVSLNDSLDVSGATALSNTLDVSGAVSLNDSLDVSGGTTLKDTLEVSGATALSNTLDVSGAVTLNDSLEVSGPTTLSNTLEVSGAVTLNDSLDVSGGTTLKDTLDVSGATALSNTLDVSGAVTLNDSLDVSGATALSNTLDVSGAVTLNDSLDVSGATALSNTLDVSGAVTLNDSLDVSGATALSNTLDVSGAVTLNDSLDVSGATALSNTLDVSGAVTLNDSLDVYGGTTLKDTLDVSGATTLSNTLDVSGAVSLNDSLDVSGATTLNDALDVSGATALSNTLDVSGAVALNDSLDVSGATTLSNTLEVSGPTTLKDTLDVSGPTTLKDALDVSGPTALSNTLDVSGAVSLNDSLDVSGATTLSNTLDVSGAVALNDSLDVSGATTLSNSLEVSGPTTLKDTLAVSGPTTLKDTLDVSGPTALSNTLDVSGAVSLNDSLDVSGATTLSSTLDVSGAVALNDSLEVSGPTTLKDALDVSGPTALSNTLDVSGAVTLNDSLEVSGATTLSNSLEVSGETSLKDALGVSGPTALSNTLDVSGAVSLNDSLEVSGESSLKDALGVSGPTTLSNTLDVSGAVALSDSLDVSGPTTLSNTLDVSGPTTLKGPVDIQGDLQVSGAAAFGGASFADARASDSMVIPRGDTVSRPDDVIGSIRYNTDLRAFEGFTAAGWSSMGGAVDGDRDTYITTSLSPGEDDDTIRFFTSDELRASIDSNGEYRVFDALVLPSGDTASRPDGTVGSVRYNTDLRAFEGYTDTGGGWSSLGGAVDGDRDTYISVEDAPGADDDTMRFFTSNVERLRITDEGQFFFNADSNAFDDDCDFVFAGKACFSNAAVAGKLSLGGIDDLAARLEVIGSASSDLDPPYVEDFAFFPIPGTSNLGGAVSVEQAGDFRVYAYATTPDVAPFTDPNAWKRFYTKQAAAGHGDAFSVSLVDNTVGASGLMDFSNVDVGMYFDSADTVALGAPRVMENYHVYRMHLLVEDLAGRKMMMKQFSTPMVAELRTNDVLVPRIGVSSAAAVSTTLGGGRIDVTVTGITDDGIGAPAYDRGAGSHGAPASASPPHVGTYVVALDRFQSFDDVDEAFAMLESGCNMTASLSNYDPGALPLTTYYTRSGYGSFSEERSMSNFRYYSPHVLIQDDHDPPNRAVHRMPDTLTLDQEAPALGDVPRPYADFATSNEHEMVFSLDGVAEDTKTLVYAWLMEEDFEFGSAAAASNFASARGAALIPHREMQPYEDLEFLPPLASGEIRLGDSFAPDGTRSAGLDDFTRYRLQTLLVDSSNNCSYAPHPAAFTRDVEAPQVTGGTLDAYQTVRTVAAGPTETQSAIRVDGFQMSDPFHDFEVYLFSFADAPPDEDTVKRRLRDGVYTPAHYASTGRLAASNTHDIELAFDGVVSTGEAPAVAPLDHGTVSYPAVFALDEADRADLPLAHGNASLMVPAHLDRTGTEPAGCNSILVDEEPPRLDYFNVLQSNAHDATSPDSNVGHPYVRMEYGLDDRHPLQAWLYYTTSPDDMVEMLAPDAADRLVDPATHGGLPASGKFTGRLEVTGDNGGAPFDVEEPIEENLRYYFFLGARDYHNNRAIYRSSPPSLSITPRDPVVVDYTFDVRDNLGHIAAGASGAAYAPSLSNTLDVTFRAQDRGRGRLDRVFFYYTSDADDRPDAETLCNLATGSNGAAASGASTGGHVWVTPASGDDAQDSDSQSHVTGQLPESSPLYLHVAAIDGYGNFSAVVRDDLFSALTAHGGLTYDMSEPALAGLTAGLHARDVATEDTKMDVEFSAEDAGGAGLAFLYVYYSSVEATLDPTEVRDLARATAPGETEGGYAVDVRSGGGGVGSATTGVITTPDLREWTPFWVYAAAEDGDGNLSRDGPGQSHRTQMLGNFAYDGAVDGADSRTWDYRYPAVSSLSVSLQTDNRVRLNYAAADAGDPASNSGLARVYVYYTTADASYTVDQVAAAAAGTAETQADGGHVWDLTPGYPVSSSGADHLTPALAETTAYFFYAVAEDRQGNRTYAKAPGTSALTDVVTKEPIPVHGGLTYDLTPPVVTLDADPYFTDESPDVRDYVINVPFTVANPAAGGAAFDRVYLYYTPAAGAYDGAHVRANAAASATATGGTFQVSGAAVSAAAPYAPWHFYVAAFDADTEATGVLPPVDSRAISAADNGGRSYDLSPPTMSFT
eukprot:jgi/Tetstr1/464204/TSEL_009009.t1